MPEHERASVLPPSDALSAAIEAARHRPDNRAHWDLLEELVDGAQRPSDVRALFRDVLSGGELAPAVASDVGQRAVRFYEAWYGDDSTELAELLARVLERDQSADWAFERLTVALTSAERWTDLLAVYDSQIAREKNTARRSKLLDDAAQLAKDFAGEPDRAIGYMTQLFALDPSNTGLSNALERLLERQARWQDLIELWRTRADSQPPRQKRDTYLRMASCYLDALHDPAASLRELSLVLQEAADYKPALDLVERILVAERAEPADRRTALRHLRDYYVRNQQPHEVVRVLELALGFSTEDDRRGLLRELVERSIDLRDDARAMLHQASLLVLEPLPQERDALRALAERTRSYEQYATALADAAAVCEEHNLRVSLWFEAGRVREETLGQSDLAIDFYYRVFRAAGSPDSTVAAGRRLLGLLEQTDRERDTLDVLLRLADLEPDVAVRRTLLGKLAVLAERLGEHERARRAWATRVEDDAEDVEALSALIAVAERDQDHTALATLLRKRTRVASAAHQRRADLMWLARIYDEKLRDIDSAIEAWRELRAQFGDDSTAVNALTELLGRANRWDELADVLRQATEGEVQRFTQLQSQLGDAYRMRLDKPDLAAMCYRSALHADPRHPGARAGQQALLAVEGCRALAVNSLHEAYRQTGEWEAALSLLEIRLEIASDDAARSELWIAAARERESLGRDPERALECYRRAFALAPNDRDTEREIRRLASELDRWDAVVSAYRETIARFTGETARVAELRYEEAQTLELRLADKRAALEAYAEAARIAPEREQFASAAARLAAELGQWERAARELLACVAAKGTSDVPFAVIDAAADASQAWDEWCRGLKTALKEAQRSLRPGLARELFVYLARLESEQRADLGAAESALKRAVDADVPELSTVRALTAIQRTRKSVGLLASLHQLIELDRDNLDLLWEAAELASEPSEVLSLFETLYDRSVSLWRRGQKPAGQRSVQAAAAYAVERLSALYRGRELPERALTLLNEATRLPFAPETSVTFLRQAAELALELPDALQRATPLYRDLLARDPSDAQALSALAKLYSEAQWLPELLALRRHELSLDPADPRRLELRLEIAQLLGELVGRGQRLQLLKQNLAEDPGHKPSLDAVQLLLCNQGAYSELAQLFDAQARVLTERGQRAQAAWLWREIAGLFERELHDSRAALAAYRELHTLEPESDASAAIARLHAALGEHAAAAEWLELRLASAPHALRAEIAVALARAHIDAGQSVQARAALEQALSQNPELVEARELLASLYRQDGAYEQLAQVLAQGESSLGDETRRLSYLREAADIYFERLNDPARAISVLTRATELAPQDVRLRGMLAEGLHVAGRYEDAKAVLRALVDSFGRKRTPERAEYHYQTARVAASAGQIDEAFSELEQATKMDLGHKAALHMLAGLAQQQGDLDRAERAYRSLLLLLRRQKGEGEGKLGPAEVLYELYRIAESRQQEQAANDLLASALEVAGQSDAEARRFTAVLRARGATDLLLRVLDARLASTREPKLEAELLAEKADILEREKQQLAAALELRLRAIALDDQSDKLHDAALSLAVQSGELARYLDVLTKLADDAERTRTPAGVRAHARHTLRLGRVIETELKDLERAASLYAKVENSGECTVDAWLSLARVAGARGDRAEQRRVLLRISELDDTRAGKAERNEARFLLAELELREPSFRDAGVETLRRALLVSQDYARTKSVLADAIQRAPDHAALLSLCERVARESHDELLLLECLERRADMEGSGLAEVREGIGIALRRDDHPRAERLLLRARGAYLAERSLAPDPTWIFSGLAECRKHVGDAAGALQYLSEAVEHAPETEARTLARELAQLASGPSGDLQLAARTYARLLATEPADRSLWEPMLRVLMQLPERERLQEFVEQTLSTLLMVDDRTFLMLAYADHLLTLSDDQAAARVLSQLIEEVPAHTEATDKLLGIYQRHGMHDELLALVEQQFDRARDERDVQAICDLGLRLAKLYAANDRDRACDVLRSALDWRADDRELLKALLALLPADCDAREQTGLMMRLLLTESADTAAPLALEVARRWQELGDEERVREALEHAYRVAPGADAVREQLEAYYARSELFQPLADFMQLEAARLGSGVAAVARLRNAASLYRDQLQDLDRAAEALRSALALAPTDLSLLQELVQDLAAAGQHATGIADVTRLLDERSESDPQRVELLRLRAELRRDAGQAFEALADVEAAYALAGEAVLPDLVASLTSARDLARESGTDDAVRTATLRLVELLESQGDHDQARAELTALSEWMPQDVEVLLALRDRELSAGRFEEVVTTCKRLIALTEGEARVGIVLTLAEAYEKLGHAQSAMPWLLRVHEDSPEVWPLRERLRQLFEQSGQQRDLAALLIGDAEYHTDTAQKLACWQQAAALYLALGDPEAATEPLQKAMALAPDDDATRLSLIDLDLALGRIDEAAASIEQAFQVHKRRSPELARFQLRMARVCALRGDTEGQLKWLNTALDTDRKSGEIASELVDAALAIADYDTAMKALRMLTMMEDPQPITRAIAFLKQAEIAHLRGDAQRALHWARKAKSLDETLQAADELLARLEG